MHDGHRERMRQRISEYGIDSLQPHEVLEYVLYHAVPRKDTNLIAHNLINKYGSLSKVLSADVDDLLTISGMTHNAAHLLISLPQILRYYQKDLQSNKICIKTRKECVDTLSVYFLGEATEKVYLLCMDAKNNVINIVLLATGIPAKVMIDARQVVDVALKQKAVSVVLAHNHPSGELEPSHADIELTRSIACALELLQIKLIDHYIFSNKGYFSFYENGIVDVINKNVDRFLKEGIRY